MQNVRKIEHFLAPSASLPSSSTGSIHGKLSQLFYENFVTANNRVLYCDSFAFIIGLVVLPEEELLSLQPAGVDPQLADDPVHALLRLERRRVFGEQEVDLRAEPRRRPERPERVLDERPRVFEAAADSATPAIAKVLGLEIGLIGYDKVWPVPKGF